MTPTLSEALDTLFARLAESGHVPPSTDVRIIEIAADSPLDARGRPRINRSDFRVPTEYESRFSELLAAGFPWVNVSCYGVADGRLVVAIELPRASEGANRTSVNDSGPTTAALANDWRLDAVVALE